MAEIQSFTQVDNDVTEIEQLRITQEDAGTGYSYGVMDVSLPYMVEWCDH